MSMAKYHSIFYTTLGDYANCGSIFDFLKENTEHFYFLDLKSRFRKDIDKSTLFEYTNGKLTKTVKMLTLKDGAPAFLAPLQHVFFFLNTLSSLRIARKADLAVTTFSVVALATVLAKKLGYCKKTLLWHWDYMPMPKRPAHFLLRFVDPLDALGIKMCDYIWYASKNQFKMRIAVGHIPNPKNAKHTIVHWGNKPSLKIPKKYDKKQLKIIYMGALLPEKGLLELLESMPEIMKTTKDKVTLTLSGAANNPEYRDFLETYVKNNKLTKNVVFTGYVKGAEKEKLLLENHLSVALYPRFTDGVKNYAHYSDPAKLRDYVSYGLPIVVSKVPEISKELEKYNAGILVDELTPASISSAVKKFISQPDKFLRGAFDFSHTNVYTEYYGHLFDSLF